MLIEEIKLNVPYEKLNLDTPKKEVIFTGYIIQNSEQYSKDRKRPALIICPGGGYAFTSDREATPVALEFLAKGFSCFVLRYSTNPSRFPVSLLELATAVKMVRENAENWDIEVDKIAVCGFSAGGHLAASLGVFWNHPILSPVRKSEEQFKPNALILCYPVITAGEKSHKSSFVNLLGRNRLAQKESLSLEKHVTDKLPPTFLWHTYTDPGVPVENSLLFANAAVASKVPIEMHIYPKGGHGLSIANELVNTPVHNVGTWIEFATEFIKNL
ncbi:acetylesterase [Candidatus Epulonipiscioides gigas]|nr:acetylesterase [Epulopiscium sp. SCG-C07WGA-EpuloA2]